VLTADYPASYFAQEREESRRVIKYWKR